MSPAVGPHYKIDHSTSVEELWAPCRTWVRCVPPCHRPHWWGSAGSPAGPWQNYTHRLRNLTTSQASVTRKCMVPFWKHITKIYTFSSSSCLTNWTNCEWGLGALMRTKWGLFHRKGPHEDLGPQWGFEGRLCVWQSRFFSFAVI